MELSAELFHQICEALRSDSSRERDKRTAPRVGLRAMVTILPPLGVRAPAERMRCRNLSASGVGLMHSKEMRSGTEFVVCLPAAGLARPVHIACVVVHCRKMSPELFSIGARILRVLTSDEAAMIAAMAA
jgi:hypothetical protein